MCPNRTRAQKWEDFMDNQWISVKEEFPRDGEEVIAVVSRFSGGIIKMTKPVCSVYSEASGFEFFGANFDSNFFVTHWLPLPAIPVDIVGALLNA